MAVEKLILRSILYGADKVPDSWFDKLPGGFYKDAEGHTRKRSVSDDKINRRRSTHDGRKAEHSDFYPEERPADRDRRRDRRRDRSRNSYDGGADDELYNSEDDKPRESQSNKGRRRSDNDWYNRDGHGKGRRDEHGRHARNGYHDDRSDRPSHPRSPGHSRKRSGPYLDRSPTRFEPRPFEPGSFVAAGATGTGAAAAEPPYSRGSYRAPLPNQPPPIQRRNGPISNGYVPYAHIYGNSRQQTSPQGFSPPRPFDDALPQNSRNRASPVAPYPQDYQQNLLAQHVPTGADSGADAAYNGQRGNFSQDSRNMNGYGSNGDARRSRSERRPDEARSKSERFVDPLQSSNRRNEDRSQSELNRSRTHGRGGAKKWREDGYYSE